MNTSKNAVVTESIFKETTGYFIGDKIPVRFKNVDDNNWNEYEVTAIWGLEVVGYTNPEQLTTVIELNGAPCAINTKKVVDDLLLKQLEEAA